jgi:hypothetical protein
MRVRALILIAAVVASSVAVVATIEPSGAVLSDPDVCQKPKNPPKNANRITGTAGNDVIFGTPGNDIIRGLAGNDQIFGGGGHDMICGGGDNDRIYGNQGADRIWGNYGNDWIDPGEGDDQVDGGADGDTINFQSANAPVWVHTGKQQYQVGNGPIERIVNVFRIEGSLWSDTIDVLDEWNNEVQGGSGDDKMTGAFFGADNLNGGPDDDLCRHDRKKKYYNCA